MKFVCEKSVLSSAIAKTSWAVATKSSVPVMEGILINCGRELTLTGYDLSIGIRVTVPAEIEEQGIIVVNAKIFSDIIRLLPDEPVTFTTDDNLMATVTCGNVRHEVVCLSAKDFPSLPDIEKKYFLNLRQGDLKKMISQTIFAISGDESKPVHTGSLFDVEGNRVTVVSVDGFRLSSIDDVTGEDGKQKSKTKAKKKISISLFPGLLLRKLKSSVQSLMKKHQSVSVKNISFSVLADR